MYWTYIYQESEAAEMRCWEKKISDFQKKEESGKNMVCRGKNIKKINTQEKYKKLCTAREMIGFISSHYRVLYAKVLIFTKVTEKH